MRRKAPGGLAPWVIAGGPDPDFDDVLRERHRRVLTDGELLERYRACFPGQREPDYEVIVRRLGYVWDCRHDGAANVVGFRCHRCGAARSEASGSPQRRARGRSGMLAIETCEDAERRFIALRGALDAASAPALRRALDAAGRSGSPRI